MNMIFDVVSPYIVAGIAGWVVAQGLKYVIVSIRKGKWALPRQLYFSGSMPSAHSATTVAVLTIIGLKDGIESGLFGLALVFTGVVLYDAMMLRRSSGEQGVALTELIKEQGSEIKLPRVAKGHTLLEVFVGVVLGLVVASLTYALMIGF